MNWLDRLNASRGLQDILSPVTGKVQELRDFAYASFARAAALEDEAEAKFKEARELAAEAQRALNIAVRLDEAVQ